jgi:hypothetical protein
MEGRKMSCRQSHAFLNKILYLCVTGLSSDNKGSISSTANWNKSRSNSKDPLSTVNNATDMCELNKNTVKTGMWTNIFRFEISSTHKYNILFKKAWLCRQDIFLPSIYCHHLYEQKPTRSKIPKGQSEAMDIMTDNTMTK